MPRALQSQFVARDDSAGLGDSRGVDINRLTRRGDIVGDRQQATRRQRATSFPPVVMPTVVTVPTIKPSMSLYVSAPVTFAAIVATALLLPRAKVPVPCSRSLSLVMTPVVSLTPSLQ